MSQISNQFLAVMPPLTIKGNDTGSTASPKDLTVAQVNAILPIFTSTLNGLVPFSGGGTSNFLRSDGSWSIPPTGTLTIGSFDGQSPSANGATIVTGVLYMQSADATHPGLVNNTTQTLSGVKTFSSAPNFSSLTASQALVLDGSQNVTTLAYTSANTASTLVERDGSNNFSAGTITAALTGTASGNTTYSANNHGVVLSSSTNAMVVIAPNASTAFPLVSGGASADPTWALLTIAGGGTGASTKSTAFDALSPMTTGGDLIYGGASGTGTRLANGSAGQILQSNGTTLAPTWVTSTPTNVTTTQVSTNASFFPLFVASSTNGSQAVDLGTGLTFNPSTNNLSTTTFTGALAGNATTATTATNATNVATTATNSTNASFFPTFVAAGTSGNQGVDTATGLTFNPSTNTLTTTTVSATLSGTATNATQIATTATNSTNASFFPTFVASSTSGNQAVDTATGLSFNPSTNTLTTTTFSGALSGNATTATSATTATNLAGGLGGSIPYQSAASTTAMLANGSSGQFLKSNGTTVAPSWANPTISLTAPTIQKFTSGSGTYTTAASVLYIQITVVGGGGGGGGGGTSTSTSGGTGGDTTFGTTLIKGSGGVGGAPGANGTGGAGGAGTLGSGPIGTALQGGSGGGSSEAAIAIGHAGGMGSASPFGGAGGGGEGNSGAAGNAAIANSGSGGGGGDTDTATATDGGGGGGGAGGYVHAIITSPSATYSYAVGAAGTAGSAGTNGRAGGAGGSGYIIVTEFYQ